MALLTWNHTCSVGVRAMDDQHGVLMDAINDLRVALVRGSGREREAAVLIAGNRGKLQGYNLPAVKTYLMRRVETPTSSLAPFQTNHLRK